jgi:hypothetical protein
MTNAVFKKTIFISLLGHVAAFSIFNLSFGHKMVKPDYNSVFFLGQVLSGSDLSSFTHPKINIKNEIILQAKSMSVNKPVSENPAVGNYYLRPALNLAFNQEKLIFTPTPTTALPERVRMKPVIMLYPELPYQFLLYFKDRQEVHIELMFNILSSGARRSIAIKRKISSGNLEADLLSMRYISHYLFIEHSNFTPESWQTVKIDLSRKND